MPTKKQEANLQRGKQPAPTRPRPQKPQTEEQLEEARGRAQAARDAKQEWEDRRDELQIKAKEDPEQVFLDLFANLSAGVTLLSEKWLKSGKEPTRALMDAL